MDNKYVLIIMGAVMGTLWWFIGEMPYFTAGAGDALMGGVSYDWWYGALIAVGLGAGSTGGSDAVSILVDGITGYISTIILLIIFNVVIMVLWTLVLQKASFDVMLVLHSTILVVISAFFTNLTLSYLKKAA